MQSEVLPPRAQRKLKQAWLTLKQEYTNFTQPNSSNHLQSISPTTPTTVVAQISTAKVRWHPRALSRGVCCPAGAAARWHATNSTVKKRVNSPLRAIDHPEDRKSVYTTSGKGTRRSEECNCLVLSQCGSALGVCALTHATPERHGKTEPGDKVQLFCLQGESILLPASNS